MTSEPTREESVQRPMHTPEVVTQQALRARQQIQYNNMELDINKEAKKRDQLKIICAN
jgi:hypothetical protein